MKRFFLLSAIAVLAFSTIESCRQQNDPIPVPQSYDYPQAYDIVGVNFQQSQDSNSLYGYNKAFSSPIYSSDIVLIYRKDGTSNGNPIWQILPKTYYITQGALDYTFNFTVNDIQLYANGDFDLSAQDNNFKNTYLLNQTFRVVVIPADNNGTVSGIANGRPAINYSDYEAVIQYYHIDESKIKPM
jgi:hypothetical protein